MTAIQFVVKNENDYKSSPTYDEDSCKDETTISSATFI